jgi:hypothetical protein
MILAKNPQTNENKSADFSAFGNGFRCIQNQSLDKCNQISQFIADGNGFGCAQNQWYRKMEFNEPILALANENGVGCIQIQSYRKMEIN